MRDGANPRLVRLADYTRNRFFESPVFRVSLETSGAGLVLMARSTGYVMQSTRTQYLTATAPREEMEASD